MGHYVAAQSEVIAMLAATGAVVLLGARIGVARSLHLPENWRRQRPWRETRREDGRR